MLRAKARHGGKDACYMPAGADLAETELAGHDGLALAGLQVIGRRASEQLKVQISDCIGAVRAPSAVGTAEARLDGWLGCEAS